MRNESIYKKILRLSEGNNLPYSFTDVYNDGRYDISMVMFGENTTMNFRESCAYHIIDLILECLDECKVSLNLHKYLEEKPLFKYSSNLLLRLELFISEDLLEESRLYNFAFNVATQSTEKSDVKLGLLMLGLFQNEISNNVIKKLGYHSEYTLYAIEAVLNFKNKNEFIFDLAKNTTGYGKVISTYFLKTDTPEIKSWMLYSGTINEVMPNISAALCLRKPDMVSFLLNETVNSKNFSAFSTLYAYAFEKNNVKKFLGSYELVNNYLEAAKTLVKTFIDFTCILSIYKSMNSKCEENDIYKSDIINNINTEAAFDRIDKKSYKTKNNDVNIHNIVWNDERTCEVSQKCSEILKRKSYKYMIQKEMHFPHCENSQIVSALSYLNMTPPFDDFIPMFERDIYDNDIFDFMLSYHKELYTAGIIDYIYLAFPEKIFSQGPMDIKKDDIDYKYEPDILLKHTLRSARSIKLYKEEFFIKCITARFPDCRIEAIYCMKQFEDLWSKNVYFELNEAAAAEPVKSIKKSLLRLIRKESLENEQEYMDNEPEVKERLKNEDKSKNSGRMKLRVIRGGKK